MTPKLRDTVYFIFFGEHKKGTIKHISQNTVFVKPDDSETTRCRFNICDLQRKDSGDWIVNQT